MKRFVKIIIGVIAALVLISCCSDIKEGVVIEKVYHKSYTYMKPHYNYICSPKTVMLRPVKVPEKWEVIIENNGEREGFFISKERFDSIEVGQHIKIE